MEEFSRLAAGWINAVAHWVDSLPVSYAFGAGMLATINPCGFIMLPSFATFYMAGAGEDEPSAGQRLGRAVLMGTLVSVAFVATFGLAGIAITSGGRFIVGWIAWAGLAIGVGLVALGAYQLLARRSLLASRTAGVRVDRSATARGVLAFGVAYAVASLGCTLPVFLIVVSSVFTASGGYIDSVGQFVQYAAGMGVVLTMITIGVAILRGPTVRSVSRALPYVEATGNLLLIFAGSYLIWYWTRDGGVL